MIGGETEDDFSTRVAEARVLGDGDEVTGIQSRPDCFARGQVDARSRCVVLDNAKRLVVIAGYSEEVALNRAT